MLTLHSGSDSTLSWNRWKASWFRYKTQLKEPKRRQQLRRRCVTESLTAPCFTAAGDNSLYAAPSSGLSICRYVTVYLQFRDSSVGTVVGGLNPLSGYPEVPLSTGVKCRLFTLCVKMSTSSGLRSWTLFVPEQHTWLSQYLNVNKSLINSPSAHCFVFVLCFLVANSSKTLCMYTYAVSL